LGKLNRDFNILIIDDDVDILKLFSKSLSKFNLQYFVKTAENISEAMELVEKTYWDTILLDLSIPLKKGGAPDLKHGLRALEILKQTKQINTPIIAITGKDDDELINTVLDLGAYYFLNKPINLKSLFAIVHNATMMQKSGFDGLTGLLNKETFHERLNAEFERVKRRNKQIKDSSEKVKLDSHLSLIFFDGDNFKEINDTYNHLVGDMVLKKISSSFIDENVYKFTDKCESDYNYLIRPYDIAARFGGDEFAIFLPEANHESAVLVAKRLSSLISSLDFSDFVPEEEIVEDHNKLSLSIGVSTFPYPNNIETPEELILLADNAMYQSKLTRSGFIYGYDKSGKIIKLG